MEGSKIKENVRHAEKPRSISTCSFADRICQTSKDKLKDKAPEFLQVQLKNSSFFETLSRDERQQLENNIIRDGDKMFVGDKEFAYSLLFTGGQNVFAAVLLHDEVTDELKCVSMGVGTKFLRDQVCDWSCDGNGDGFSGCSRDHSRVRDMHAEVMAKKGFMRYLAGRFRRDSSPSPGEDLSGPAVLPERQTVHFYVSSAPCGNSIIKKWAKPSLGLQFVELKPNQWPGKYVSTKNVLKEQSCSSKTIEEDKINANDTLNNTDSIEMEREDKKLIRKLRRQERNSKKQKNKNLNLRQPFHFTAKEEGQGAVLCKGKTLSDAEKATLSFDIPNATHVWQGKIYSKKIKLTSDSESEIDKQVRQGPFTCSDKLLLWQHLGFQGSQLSHLVSNVSLSTITVGRKFSLPHLERALFGRLNGKPRVTVEQKPVVCMVTKLKFDENILEDCDASFEDARCYWWADSEYGEEELEVLNGSEGRLYGSGEKSLLVQELETSGGLSIYAAQYKASKELILDYLETLKPKLNKM